VEDVFFTGREWNPEATEVPHCLAESPLSLTIVTTSAPDRAAVGHRKPRPPGKNAPFFRGFPPTCAIANRHLHFSLPTRKVPDDHLLL
jgi:hypothetical protein